MAECITKKNIFVIKKDNKIDETRKKFYSFYRDIKRWCLISNIFILIFCWYQTINVTGTRITFSLIQFIDRKSYELTERRYHCQLI